MKKIISFALVFILLLSVMPMAFATAETQRELYIQELVRMLTYSINYYDDTSFKSDLADYSNEYFKSNNIVKIEYDKKWLDENEDKLAEYIKIFKELNESIELKIKTSGVTVVIDSYNLWNVFIPLFANYGEDFAFNIIDNIINSGAFDEVYCLLAADESIAAFNMLEEGGTQAEFDAKIEKMLCILECAEKHLEGDHSIEAYIDAGDGTHKATCSICKITDVAEHIFDKYVDAGDGTHIAVCTVCQKAEFSAHSFGEYIDEGNGTHITVCDFCNKTESSAHTFCEYIDNGDGTHKLECAICDSVEVSVHNFGGYIDAGNGTHKTECELCAKTEITAHSFGSCIDAGNGTHIAVCTVCEKAEISIHTFGEYVSNNDATEFADGTKTARCEDCNAADTMIDEGTKLEKAPDDNTSNEGSLSFVQRIIKFFTDLFAKIRNLFSGF